MANESLKIKKVAIKSVDSLRELTIRPEFSDASAIIRDYRKKSWELYQSIPLPTETDEDWRRTSLKSANLPELRLLSSDAGNIKFPRELKSSLADRQHGGQILFSHSTVDRFLDPELVSQGVIFEDILSAVEKYPELVERLINRLDLQPRKKFSALAGALPMAGVVLYIPKNVVVSSPLQSLYWSPEDGVAHGSHVFVYLEDGASVTFVHEFASPQNLIKSTLHTGVIDVYVGQGASLRFVELQSWGENVWNVTRENVDIDRDGNVDWVFGALGSKLTKNYSDLNLVGQGSTGKISGFYFTDNQQHLDHDTQQNHLAADTTSDLLFKGALLDESRSVWQGMIYVAPNAARTDGYQANRNLVLSEKARADSIPGLEILTDDVRCTHGATVGKIDKEEIFYLQSRGMPKETAERLIVEGFFDPIMQRIPFEGVKKRFQKAIKDKMEHIGRNN